MTPPNPQPVFRLIPSKPPVVPPHMIRLSKRAHTDPKILTVKFAKPASNGLT